MFNIKSSLSFLSVEKEHFHKPFSEDLFKMLFSWGSLSYYVFCSSNLRLFTLGSSIV